MSQTLTKWEPFRELVNIRKEMDRLFDDFYSQPLLDRSEWAMPLVDLYQTDDEIVVKATLPGIEADDLDIQITGDVLTIQAETKFEDEVEDAKYHLRERRYQSFSRSLTLPVPVIADEAVAEMENGMLHLSIPKAEEAKPKLISVKAK